MVDRNTLPTPLTEFGFENSVIAGDVATVTIAHGALALRFPMVRRNGEWFLAIGKVERLPWDG